MTNDVRITGRSSAEIIETVRRKAGPELADELDELLLEAGEAAQIDQMLSRDEVARRLRISEDNLDRLHARGEGPPRFKVSPRRWGYPLQEFRKWHRARLRAAETAAG